MWRLTLVRIVIAVSWSFTGLAVGGFQLADAIYRSHFFRMARDDIANEQPNLILHSPEYQQAVRDRAWHYHIRHQELRSAAMHSLSYALIPLVFTAISLMVIFPKLTVKQAEVTSSNDLKQP